MVTADEILATMAEETAETEQAAEVCTIDRCTRAVTIPEALRIVGVETDKDVTRRRFRVLCSYRGTNLSTFRIRIHFQNANKEKDIYYVTDAAQDGEYLTFSWVISRKATAYKGKLQFIACMVCDGGTDEEREWNSTLGEFTVLEGLEVELTEDEEEQARDAIVQLLENIEAQGATQIAAVQAAGAKQEAIIAAKGAETLATIPDDYAALYNKVQQNAAALNDKAPAIIDTMTGPVCTTDIAANMPLAGLRLYGKTTQDGTPTPSVPAPLVNVGAGGSIGVKVCGKNLLKRTDLMNGMQVSQPGDAAGIVDGYGWRKEVPVGTDTPILGATNDLACLRPGVTYTFSFLAWCSGTGNARVDCYPDTLPETGITLTSTPTRYTWTFASDRPEMALARIRIYGANTGSDTWIVRVVDIKLEVGSAATPFEAYKDGGSLTASTPDGLPGIPVSSGGNYVDEHGQMWLCDELDFGRGVYVRRIGTIKIGASTGLGAYGGSGVFVTAAGQNVGNLLCNIAAYANRSALYSGTDYGVSDNLAYNQIVFRLEGCSTVDEHKALFASLEASGNPVTVVHALATPVETPLSADELAAFRAMVTHKPATTVYNDADAGMQADYCADTKLYIDKQLAAIVGAMLNM